MVSINPKRIPGRWVDGYTLDYHAISSEFIGYDEYGHAQFDTTRSEIGELLYRLKYRSDRDVIAEIVDTAVAFYARWHPGAEMLIPVTPSRQRNFQPVVALGEAIAQQLNLTFAPNVIHRVRDVPELKDVHDYDERLRLLQGAHQVDANATRGRRILLFDDLYRSGATMNEITANLYDRGGAAAVYALSITRTRGR